MRKQTKLWKQRDGKRIRICDMTDTHIVNCVKMLKRKAEFKKMRADFEYLSYGGTDGIIGPRGEQALIAFENECEEVWSLTWQDYVPDIFESMLKDIARRAQTKPGILNQLIGIPNWMLGR